MTRRHEGWVLGWWGPRAARTQALKHFPYHALRTHGIKYRSVCNHRDPRLPPRERDVQPIHREEPNVFAGRTGPRGFLLLPVMEHERLPAAGRPEFEPPNVV